MTKKIYRFSGIDGLSDYGGYEILVKAINEKEARILAENHLRNNNRKELISGMACFGEVSIKDGIIYSSVEKRRK